MNRFCSSCNQNHGPLYICPEYSPELQEKIRKDQDQYIANLRSPVWCRAQIAKGLPIEVLMTFRALAGLANDDYDTNS